VVVVWDVSRLVARVGGAGRCRAPCPPPGGPWSYRVEGQLAGRFHKDTLFATSVELFISTTRWLLSSSVRCAARYNSSSVFLLKSCLQWPILTVMVVIIILITRRRTMEIRDCFGKPSLVLTKQVIAVTSCVLWVFVGPPYGWTGQRSGSGLSDIAGPVLGVFASSDRL
jgi:hypothetical protein